MEFLDVDDESHRLVLSLLGPRDLCSLAGTCRYFYRAVNDGVHAEQIWRQWCMDLLGPGTVALHGSAVPAGYRAGAIYWRDLWIAGHKLDHIRWWRQGAHQLRISAAKATEEEAIALRLAAETEALKIAAADPEDGLGPQRHAAVLAEHAAAASGTLSLQSSLARSAHTADLLGTRIVITGGILRDGATHVDVVVVDLANMSIHRPAVRGEPPSTRFRHTTALVKPSPGTQLDDIVLEALGPNQQIDAGDLLFCFGGYNTTGEEFGADSTYVLWAAKDGSQHLWIHLKPLENAPSPRFHHSCNSFADGKKVIVFGGEGYMLDDAGEGLAPCAYILDVDTLTWQRCSTHPPSPDHSPGNRSLHVTTVRVSPRSGKEELVVVGGYSSTLLAEMRPYTLDLESLYWRCWPGLEKDGREDVLLPTPRQRMGDSRVTADWLLICGGSPTSVGAQSAQTGNFLDDVQRLHIPTLTWRKPPKVSGRPSRALRRIAGHSFSGLLAFGGCIPTIMGIMPVEKLDLLLLGQANKGLIPVDTTQANAASESQTGMLISSAPPAPLSEGSDADSPSGSGGSAGPPAGRKAAGRSLQDEVLDQLMADQALSKGQRVNIGSPGSFFRPVYATVAGTKRSTQGKMQGKLQIINTSVLSDTELLAQTEQRMQEARLSQPASDEEGDEAAAAAAAAAFDEAAASSRGEAYHESGASGSQDTQAEAGPSSSTCRRVYRRSVSAPAESWQPATIDDKGKGKMSELRPHDESPRARPASREEEDASAAGDGEVQEEEEASDQFVPLLLLWNRPEMPSGDDLEQPSSSMERVPSVDGVGPRAASRRYVLCGGTEPPVLLEATNYGVKSILTAAKAEVFRVPGRPTAPWPVHGGAHAMYVVYSVRNGMKPLGPNPFASMRVPWQPSWWDPKTGVGLQPPDADLDAMAADRLRYGDTAL